MQKFLLLTFLSLATSAAAIEKYGFLVGGNISSGRFQISSANGVEPISSRLGFFFEGVFQVPLNHFLYFQSGLGLVGKGDSQPGFDERFTFCEIPLRVRTEFPGEKITPYFFAGLGAGILVSAERKTSFGIESEFDDYLNRNELSGQLGAGVEYRLNPSLSLNFGVTYSHGLTNLIDHLPSSYGTVNSKEVSYYSRGLYLGVGLVFSDQPQPDDTEERAKEYIEQRKTLEPEAVVPPEPMAVPANPSPSAEEPAPEAESLTEENTQDTGI